MADAPGLQPETSLTQVAATSSFLRWATRLAPALRSRNFRLFWIGQTFSLVGTSLQVVAEGWLIYDLTGSTFWLGMAGLLGLLPVLPVSLLGGVLIDRVPRRKLILFTQCALLVQATVFGLLVISGQLVLWHIIVLYFCFGAILAIDHPARRAFLVELVEPAELANAVALNGAVFNLSSLIGYAAGGLLIATLGAGAAILLNAATFLAPIIALSLIRVADVGAEQKGAHPASATLMGAMTEGLLTLRRQPAVLGAISLMAVVGGLTWPLFGLLPAYAEQVVHTSAIGLGLLMAAGALGSVLGTVLVALLGARQRGRTLALVSFILPLLILAFGWTTQIIVAGLILVAAGAALLVLQSLAITIVQLQTPDRVRGRVMSLYSMLHAGADTMGNVAVGGAAAYLGLPWALCVGGVAAALYALGLRAVLPAVHKLD